MRLPSLAVLMIGMNLAPPSALAADAAAGPGFECLIEPRAVVEVGIPVGGVVAEMQVDRGDPVREGQLLARLDSRVEEATVAVARQRAESRAGLQSARTRLAFAERKLARTRDLADKKFASGNEMDEAQTEHELAALEIEQVQEEQRLAALELDRAVAQLVQREVRSPIDGFVVERLHDVGALVEEGPLLTLAQVQPLNIEVLLPARLAGVIRPGMRAMVEPEFPADTRFEAVVTVLDPVVDAASGLFGIRLEYPNEANAIKAGLECRVWFEAFSDPP